MNICSWDVQWFLYTYYSVQNLSVLFHDIDKIDSIGININIKLAKELLSIYFNIKILHKMLIAVTDWNMTV